MYWIAFDSKAATERVGNGDIAKGMPQSMLQTVLLTQPSSY